jgi:hypothetical protein
MKSVLSAGAHVYKFEHGSIRIDQARERHSFKPQLVMREARLGCNAFGMCLLRTKTLAAAVLQTKTPQNGGITCHHGILKFDHADL